MLQRTTGNSDTLGQFKTKIKNGTEKYVLANYAASSFQTWAMYDI